MFVYICTVSFKEEKKKKKAKKNTISCPHYGTQSVRISEVYFTRLSTLKHSGPTEMSAISCVRFSEVSGVGGSTVYSTSYIFKSVKLFIDGFPTVRNSVFGNIRLIIP